jgi:hypothetical protein
LAKFEQILAKNLKCLVFTNLRAQNLVSTPFPGLKLTTREINHSENSLSGVNISSKSIKQTKKWANFSPQDETCATF